MFYFILLVLSIIIFLIYKNKSLWSLNPNMKIQKFDNTLIIDDFYLYPDKVRNYALKFNYKPHTSLYKTMYADPKCNSTKMAEFINQLSKIENKQVNKELWNFFNMHESNGYFQFLTQNDSPKIHSDGDLRTLIIYLHPWPTTNSGTVLYKHKNFGSKIDTNNQYINADLENKNKWTPYLKCKNKYNRAIFFNGNNYHASEGGFGLSKENSRLYQTFFYTFNNFK